MSNKIGVISQKGGVGKSIICRMIATEYSKAGWEVLIADMDTSQSTSFEWNSRRIANGVEPHVSVQQFPSVDRAVKIGEAFDLVVFDGAPHATRASEQIAQECDMVILPTGNSKDDLDPQIRLAHELVKKGIPHKKIHFLLSRIGSSEAETKESIEYLQYTNYKVFTSCLSEKTGYRRAVDEGKSITETGYKSLNDKADSVMQCVVDALSSVS